MTVSDPADGNFLPSPPPLLAIGHSLLLDFDGTLVELVDRPDAVVADDLLKSQMARLAGTFGGRIALVSGRSISQLSEFFGGSLDRLGAVGSHGAEMLVGSQAFSPERPSTFAAAEKAALSAFGERDGLVVEVKTLGIALHFRLAPDAEQEVRTLARQLADQSGLTLQEGKMMIELRIPGHDKGTGIAAVMAHPPFAGTRPVFIGDDITDEAGFLAAANFGGFGVLVGEPRPTAARYRLDSVTAVRAWLDNAT